MLNEDDSSFYPKMMDPPFIRAMPSKCPACQFECVTDGQKYHVGTTNAWESNRDSHGIM